jgi:hypothetical protein
MLSAKANYLWVSISGLLLLLLQPAIAAAAVLQCSVSTAPRTAQALLHAIKAAHCNYNSFSG